MNLADQMAHNDRTRARMLWASCCLMILSVPAILLPRAGVYAPPWPVDLLHGAGLALLAGTWGGMIAAILVLLICERRSRARMAPEQLPAERYAILVSGRPAALAWFVCGLFVTSLLLAWLTGEFLFAILLFPSQSWPQLLYPARERLAGLLDIEVAQLGNKGTADSTGSSL